ARQLIAALPRWRDPRDPATLDALHALATRCHIVSAYSSMLVLVDDAQRQALKRAESEADRFQRSAETGEERLSKPSSFGGDLTGTPEPEEWVLICVVVAAG